MSNDITGACLCGAVRFRYRGEIGPAAYCHCADCRRTTGSAFNISIGMDRDTFEITAGAPRAFTKTADSGNELTRHFCGDCGSPVYTSSPVQPDRVYVKAGLLDDPSLVRPARQAWTASKVAWADIDPALPGFARGD